MLEEDFAPARNEPTQNLGPADIDTKENLVGVGTGPRIRRLLDRHELRISILI